MSTGLNLDTIEQLTNGRLGVHDVPCPLCGPFKSHRGQRRDVLRVWRVEPGFATFHCARCGEAGYVRDCHAPEPDPACLARAKADAAEHARIHAAERLRLARWLWSQRLHPQGTIVATYLQRRAINCPIPGTIGFLPASRDYPPAMITAFGMARETCDGGVTIRDDAVRGVHLTRLKPDGTDRERGDRAKIMIGHSAGFPIILAPLNDLLGMAISEGIEDALTAHESTGLGAWAAGSASRMTELADVIPSYVGCVNVVEDDDPDGRRHSAVLADRLCARGIEVRRVIANRWRPAA
jgi:Toprim domain